MYIYLQTYVLTRICAMAFLFVSIERVYKSKRESFQSQAQSSPLSSHWLRWQQQLRQVKFWADCPLQSGYEKSL